MSLLPAAMKLPDDIAPLGRPIRHAEPSWPSFHAEVVAFNHGDHQPDGTVLPAKESRTKDEICADIIAGLTRILVSLHEEIPPVMVLPAPPQAERPSADDLLALFTPDDARKIAIGGQVPLVINGVLRARQNFAQKAVHASTQQPKWPDVTLETNDQRWTAAHIPMLAAELKTMPSPQAGEFIELTDSDGTKHAARVERHYTSWMSVEERTCYESLVRNGLMTLGERQQPTFSLTRPSTPFRSMNSTPT